MKTTLSSKGQIVLPAAVRERLGLLPGATLEVEVEVDRIVLRPERPDRVTVRQELCPVTGLPVMELEGDAPPLTSAQVKALLADFP